VAALTTLDPARGENTHRWPLFLPDGRRLLYLVRGEQAPYQWDLPQFSGTAAGQDPGTRDFDGRCLLTRARKAPGVLYWVRQQTLLAQPFDTEHAQFSGDAVPVPGAHIVAFGAGIRSL